MFAGKRRRKNKREGLKIAPGMRLAAEFFHGQEKGWGTVLADALIVFLLVAGGLGGLAASIGTPYFKGVFYAAVLAFSLFISFFNRKRIYAWVGYPLFAAAAAWIGFYERFYILDGLKLLFNDFSLHIGKYFHYERPTQYFVEAADHEAAVTFALVFAGAVFCIDYHLTVMKSKSYGWVLAEWVILFFLPMLIKLEPDTLSAAMMTAGTAAVFLLKQNKCFRGAGEQFCTDRKERVRYTSDGPAYAFAAVEVLILSVLSALACTAVLDMEALRYGRPDSELKSRIVDALKDDDDDLKRAGGGLSGGQLDGVDGVILNYETDLILSVEAGRTNAVYLKGFTGQSYVPYENRWTEAENVSFLKAAYLEKVWRNGGAGVTRGTMEILNVDASVRAFLPYYSNDILEVIGPGETGTYTYYNSDSVRVPEEAVGEWLEAPSENLEALALFCSEAGFDMEGAAGYREDPMEAVRRVRLYFEDNYAYTLTPGMTPLRTDYVNYFLTGSKKGYCAHFASAAVLIFRYLGIPARYVEGYAVSSQILSDAAEEAGPDGLIRAEVSDASAHAWVEIYDDGAGWIVADVTPPAAQPIRQGAAAGRGEVKPKSFWEKIGDYIDEKRDAALDRDSDERSYAGGPDPYYGKIDAFLRSAAVIAVKLAVILFWFFLAGAAVTAAVYYLRLDPGGRLLLCYRLFLKWKGLQDPGLKERLNEKSQLAYLKDKGLPGLSSEEAERLLEILQKAGYSRNGITPEEGRWAAKKLKALSVKNIRRD